MVFVMRSQSSARESIPPPRTQSRMLVAHCQFRNSFASIKRSNGYYLSTMVQCSTFEVLPPRQD